MKKTMLTTLALVLAKSYDDIETKNEKRARKALLQQKQTRVKSLASELDLRSTWLR